MTVNDELEEYEIKIKQDKHEKNILKAEIMRLRLKLAKYELAAQSMKNLNHISHVSLQSHDKAATSATFEFSDGDNHLSKVARMASEPVPKFTDNEITEFEANGAAPKEGTGTGTSFRTDDQDGYLKGIPLTPTNASHTSLSQSHSMQSLQSHSRSRSKSHSGSNKNAQTLISTSPLSPLSENMQNIILSFPTTFSETNNM